LQRLTALVRPPGLQPERVAQRAAAPDVDALALLRLAQLVLVYYLDNTHALIHAARLPRKGLEAQRIPVGGTRKMPSPQGEGSSLSLSSEGEVLGVDVGQVIALRRHRGGRFGSRF